MLVPTDTHNLRVIHAKCTTWAVGTPLNTLRGASSRPKACSKGENDSSHDAWLEDALGSGVVGGC